MKILIPENFVWVLFYILAARVKDLDVWLRAYNTLDDEVDPS